MLPDPVLIVGNHRLEHVSPQLESLAALALAQGKAPIVLHPDYFPWLACGNTLHPAATLVGESILKLVARNTGAKMWVLLEHGEGSDTPRWALGSVRAWQRHAGRMPSRIRRGEWAGWAQAFSAAGADFSATHYSLKETAW